MTATEMTLTDTTLILDDDAIDRLEERIERVAIMMDSAVRIPGTGLRFGADSVLGLVPGIGDLASAGVSAYLIWEARRTGLGNGVIVRMAGNVALDTVVGSVPVLGNIFDFFFKANLRNVDIMRREIMRLRADRARPINPAPNPASARPAAPSVPQRGPHR